jgi:hypothetical protein
VSDGVIDAIREVDPCPHDLGPPPIEMVRRRLADEPEDGGPPPRSRLSRLSTVAVALSSLAVVAVSVLAIAVLGHAHRGRTARPSAADAGVTACRSSARTAILPAWARTGFSDPRPRMPYALGRSGQIAAILWGSLDSPPSHTHTNKILWVSRVPPASSGSDLRIEAQRMSGTRSLGAPVSRRVIGGPGPSIINLPAAGCWRLTLRWAGHTDHVDLTYARAG